MKPEERQELKQNIEEAIEAQKILIASLAETSKPVAPDNAIGRLSRMEALNDRAVSEASLNAARHKLSRLETALGQSGSTRFRTLRQLRQSHPSRPHTPHARSYPLCSLLGKELTVGIFESSATCPCNIVCYSFRDI